jgi:DNA-binding response OmpR family regulator
MDGSARLLLIDDDIELGRLLQRFMAAEGYPVELAGNGRRGIQQAASGHFALILLDVMMPDMSGFDVLRRIRLESRTPVLMLTARGDNRAAKGSIDLRSPSNSNPRTYTAAQCRRSLRPIGSTRSVRN